MLSESSAAVVTATLPVVRAHADQITGRIAHKHASLGITAGQYPLVGVGT